MSETAQSAEEDIRPVVPLPSAGNTPLFIFLGLLLISGIFIFNALNERRNALMAPAVSRPNSDTGPQISAAPPLLIPESERPVALRMLPIPRVTQEVTGPLEPNTVVRAAPRPVPAAQSEIGPDFEGRFAREAASPFLVQSNSLAETRNYPNSAPSQPELAPTDRVRASRLTNPSVTVPQGTVIPAVLETALDSTRPGGARALVQRDVHSFDGSRILIPRGSRLYGTYEAGINPGEKRALVQWTRLLRPDGVTIALDSPSSDPLGRAGIEGDVNSRFFARFGGAILQSVLDIGVGVATRKATDGVIVALPGSTQNVTAQTQSQARPVLKVDQGTSVSVFVARDLDFSTVE